MKITRRQLRKLIREAISDHGGQAAGAVSAAPTPDGWADQNGLSVELDEEGQKIIYMSNEEADILNFPPGVSWDAKQNYDGETWTVYTGEYQ